MTDPFVGQLAFFRVYSGHVESGTSVLNTTKGNTERIGRLLQMHANKREEIKEVWAGDIGAAVGLRSVTTGDTICDRDKPIVLETMTFPGAGHRRCHRAEDEGRSGKDGRRAREAHAGRPDVQGPHGPGNEPDHHPRHGRAAPRDHRRSHGARVRRCRERRQAAGRVSRRRSRASRKPKGKFVRQSGRQGPVRPREDALRADHRRGGLRVRQRDRRRLGSARVHQAGRAGHQGSARARHRGRLPDDGRAGDPVRRLVPRRRLERNGVQDRRLDGVPGRRQESGSDSSKSRSWTSKS